jgi:hypothetical protein
MLGHSIVPCAMTFTRLNGVTTQTTGIFITTAVITSNLVQQLMNSYVLDTRRRETFPVSRLVTRGHPLCISRSPCHATSCHISPTQPKDLVEQPVLETAVRYRNTDIL